jgi:hypothetical protein
MAPLLLEAHHSMISQECLLLISTSHSPKLEPALDWVLVMAPMAVNTDHNIESRHAIFGALHLEVEDRETEAEAEAG